MLSEGRWLEGIRARGEIVQQILAGEGREFKPIFSFHSRGGSENSSVVEEYQSEEHMDDDDEEHVNSDNGDQYANSDMIVKGL